MTLNTALTRMLNQGLRAPTCPLCHVAHKLDREYIWHFFDGYSDSGEAMDELRASNGFCATHAEQLRAVEVDGLRSTLGISTVYLETLEGLAGQLAALEPGDPLPAREQCPACRYREEELARNARNLHRLVEENPQARERFTGGPGLCVAHFRLAWEQASQTEQRRRLLAVQRAATSGAAEALRAHIDRQTDRAAGDPPGTDGDAWQLAIRMTAGWP